MSQIGTVPEFGLETLFPGLSAAQFLSQHWPNKPLVGHGALSRLSPLLAIPELLNLEALLSTYREPVTCWGSRPDVSVDVGGEQAHVLYQAGFTLYIVGADKWVKALRPFVQRLELQLGLQPGAGSCNVFASRPGSGAIPHYDVAYGFSVQIKGRKTWTLAENTSVVNPTRTYSIGSEVDPELASYAAPLPESMPDASVQVEMEPGDVLFTPSGRWHRTLCRDDSVALDFNFAMRPWIEWIMPLIRAKLVAVPAFRERTVGVLGGPSERAAARQDAEKLLRQVPAILQNLSFDGVLAEILKMSPGDAPSACYERVPQSRLEVGRSDDGDLALTSVSSSGERREAEAELPFREICEWIGGRDRPFSVLEAIDAARPAVPPPDVLSAIRLLEELQVVRRLNG